MDPRWVESFEAFFADVGPRPGPGWSLDRIHNDGPYISANCRWSLPKEQAANRRDNRPVVLRGRRWRCYAELCRLLGMSVDTVRYRERSGWGTEAAFCTPAGKKKGTQMKVLLRACTICGSMKPAEQFTDVEPTHCASCRETATATEWFWEKVPTTEMDGTTVQFVSR
jgi:hypothetical protein